VGTSSTNSFTSTGLANGTTYFYVVTAVNTAGESGNSNEASATPFLAIPSAPTGLTATAGNAQVSLSWTASAGATSYNVNSATVSGGPYTAIGTSASTSFTNTGLTNGTTYYYVVTAVNTAGESGNSNQTSATPTAVTARQILLNPGFESGTASWAYTAGVIGQNGPSQPAHSGTWDAWMCGYGASHTDTIYQTVAIPSTVTSATLSFWMHIDTAETTTSIAYDTCNIQIRNTGNSLLKTLATYSNLNKAAGYVQKSFDVTAYKGQTIRVYVRATEDASLQTSFVFDDFALTTK
jgi:chitodextrinase